MDAKQGEQFWCNSCRQLFLFVVCFFSALLLFGYFIFIVPWVSPESHKVTFVTWWKLLYSLRNVSFFTSFRTKLYLKTSRRMFKSWAGQKVHPGFYLPQSFWVSCGSDKIHCPLLCKVLYSSVTAFIHYWYWYHDHLSVQVYGLGVCKLEGGLKNKLANNSKVKVLALDACLCISIRLSIDFRVSEYHKPQSDMYLDSSSSKEHLFLFSKHVMRRQSAK